MGCSRTLASLLCLVGIQSSHSRSHYDTLVDPDTPAAMLVTARLRDGSPMQLVMSDEFSADGRSFSKGDDALFEAVEKPDDSNEAIQFCNKASLLIKMTSECHNITGLSA